uniref:Uncharacterized protein n=1 Tax=Oryza punctata TaxID=4537 RepID=A0A0E0M6W7_ORYPU
MWSHFHDLKEREEQNGKIIPKWRRGIIREKRICVPQMEGLIFLHAWLYLHRPGVRTLSADMIMKLIQMLQSADRACLGWQCHTKNMRVPAYLAMVDLACMSA